MHDTLRRLIPIPDFKEQCRIADFLDKKAKNRYNDHKTTGV